VDHLLNWLWQGSVVALATSVILRLLRRARAEFRYVLSWIGLAIVLTLPVLPLLSAIAAPLPDPVAGTLPASGVIVAVPNVWWTSTTLIVSVWAIWFAVHGVRTLTALVALRKARGRCLPFPAQEESRLVRWNDVRELGRRTRLVMSDDVSAAAVLGCGSPIIAIARGLIGHLDQEELDRIVVHEWAHVQRRDDLLNLGQLAVRALAGWHPAVWWLNRQLQIERESACDEATIALTGCAKGYAASLAKTAALLPARNRMLTAVGALSSPGFRNRIIRILSYGRLVSRTWSASTAATAALGLCVLAFCLAGFRVIGLAALAAPFEPIAILETTPTDRVTPAAPSPVRQSASPNRRTKPPAPGQLTSGRITRTQAAAPDGSPSIVMTAREAAHDAADRPAPPPSPPTLAAVSSGGVPMARGVTLDAPLLTAPPNDATPWGAAADTGVAVGRASQKAAVATAGFFSRLGKKIAGSF
jgi:beta-lactamase regulating signal transducer with metallopeptidase domain